MSITILKKKVGKSLIAKNICEEPDSICFAYLGSKTLNIENCFFVRRDKYSLKDFILVFKSILEANPNKKRNNIVIYTNENEIDIQPIIRWVYKNENKIKANEITIMMRR